MNLLTSINVDFDDSGIVISDTVTMCYGVGPDFVEALCDYCETVLEWRELNGDKYVSACADDYASYEEMIEFVRKFPTKEREILFGDTGTWRFPLAYSGKISRAHSQKSSDEPTILERGNHLRRKGKYANY